MTLLWFLVQAYLLIAALAGTVFTVAGVVMVAERSIKPVEAIGGVLGGTLLWPLIFVRVRQLRSRARWP